MRYNQYIIEDKLLGKKYYYQILKMKKDDNLFIKIGLSIQKFFKDDNFRSIKEFFNYFDQSSKLNLCSNKNLQHFIHIMYDACDKFNKNVNDHFLLYFNCQIPYFEYFLNPVFFAFQYINQEKLFMTGEKITILSLDGCESFFFPNDMCQQYRILQYISLYDDSLLDNEYSSSVLKNYFQLTKSQNCHFMPLRQNDTYYIGEKEFIILFKKIIWIVKKHQPTKIMLTYSFRFNQKNLKMNFKAFNFLIQQLRTVTQANIVFVPRFYSSVLEIEQNKKIFYSISASSPKVQNNYLEIPANIPQEILNFGEKACKFHEYNKEINSLKHAQDIINAYVQGIYKFDSQPVPQQNDSNISYIIHQKEIQQKLNINEVSSNDLLAKSAEQFIYEEKQQQSDLLTQLLQEQFDITSLVQLIPILQDGQVVKNYTLYNQNNQIYLHPKYSRYLIRNKKILIANGFIYQKNILEMDSFIGEIDQIEKDDKVSCLELRLKNMMIQSISEFDGLFWLIFYQDLETQMKYFTDIYCVDTQNRITCYSCENELQRRMDRINFSTYITKNSNNQYILLLLGGMIIQFLGILALILQRPWINNYQRKLKTFYNNLRLGVNPFVLEIKPNFIFILPLFHTTCFKSDKIEYFGYSVLISQKNGENQLNITAQRFFLRTNLMLQLRNDNNQMIQKNNEVSVIQQYMLSDSSYGKNERILIHSIYQLQVQIITIQNYLNMQSLIKQIETQEIKNQEIKELNNQLIQFNEDPNIKIEQIDPQLNLQITNLNSKFAFIQKKLNVVFYEDLYQNQYMIVKQDNEFKYIQLIYDVDYPQNQLQDQLFLCPHLFTSFYVKQSSNTIYSLRQTVQPIDENYSYFYVSYQIFKFDRLESSKIFKNSLKMKKCFENELKLKYPITEYFFNSQQLFVSAKEEKFYILGGTSYMKSQNKKNKTCKINFFNVSIQNQNDQFQITTFPLKYAHSQFNDKQEKNIVYFNENSQEFIKVTNKFQKQNYGIAENNNQQIYFAQAYYLQLEEQIDISNFSIDDDKKKIKPKNSIEFYTLQYESNQQYQRDYIEILSAEIDKKLLTLIVAIYENQSFNYSLLKYNLNERIQQERVQQFGLEQIKNNYKITKYSIDHLKIEHKVHPNAYHLRVIPSDQTLSYCPVIYSKSMNFREIELKKK